mmetsp:Transcript_25461/g.38443  ORF Transcript_25461/g.38443 Transcript_25461/m.38443 type:complete len:354 (-) Transcript_25461:120-1181(-)
MQESSNIIVSFRGTKVTIDLNDDDKNQTVGDIKAVLGEKVSLLPSEIKLLWKGKLLSDDNQKLHQLFVGVAKKKTHRLMAMGTSSSESDTMEKEYEHGMREAKLIRDDLTVAGKQQLEQQRQRGRLLMNQSRRKDASSSSFLYGFGKIETLPSLLHRDTARAILNKLANDPGILACMAKHQWKVGSLAELYPEGKVGESAVCVMGLNKNKGQQILLRIRTDDLCGFRKYLNIKKVLYHELAHNVHSEHDGQFFQLMRQIERECTDMDWTNGKGISLTEKEDCSSYTGGVYTLGGKTHPSDQLLSPRELAARAAETRLTAEEIEIQQNCGCGRANDIFLPKNPPPDQQDHTNDS